MFHPQYWSDFLSQFLMEDKKNLIATFISRTLKSISALVANRKNAKIAYNMNSRILQISKNIANHSVFKPCRITKLGLL